MPCEHLLRPEVYRLNAQKAVFDLAALLERFDRAAER